MHGNFFAYRSEELICQSSKERSWWQSWHLWKKEFCKITGVSTKCCRQFEPWTKNHIFVKGTSKYLRCKYCGTRSICLCQKCNVALQPDYFKDYHSWNTKGIVFLPTGRANKKFRHFINVSLASLWSSVVSENLQFFSPIIFLGLARCVNLMNIRYDRRNFQ